MKRIAFTNETEIFAEDLRAVFTGWQEGAIDDGLLVTDGAAGLSIDVAEGVAFVQGDAEAGQGIYRVELTDPENSSAFADGGIEPAHATLPRVDRIIARAYDDDYDSSGLYAFRLEVVTGTPTAGATLVNENGISALPATALDLAHVLVPATATSIDPGDIEDLRPNAAAIFDVSADLAEHVAETRVDNPHGIDTELDAIETTLAGKIAAALVDAKGDLIAATADGVVARVAVGADGQRLVADSGAAAGVSWSNPADSSISITDEAPTTVDPTSDLTVTGTGGIVATLSDDGGGAATLDIDGTGVAGSGGIAVNTVDAKGDLIVGTADDTVDNLTVGADETQLVADSGEVGGVRWGVSTFEKGVVVHGSTAGTARPTGYTSVEWIGDVEPTNAVDNDTWIDTSA